MRYEIPDSALYWRNAVNYGPYRSELRAQFDLFKKNLLSAIPTPEEGTLGEIERKIRFRSSVENGQKNPYIDLSPYVKNCQGYTVGVAEMSNTISLSLSPGELIAGQGLGASGEELSEKTALSLDNLGISENDLIMVRSRHSPEEPYELEYLGFVTDVDYNKSYGKVQSVEITADGVSKFFQTTQVIRQRSLNNNDFILGSEVGSGTVSLYSHQYNGFNTERILTSLLHDVLNYKKIDGPDFAPTSYEIDFSAFTGESGIQSFQHSIFILLQLYLLQINYPAVGNKYWQPNTTLLDSTVRALLTGGKQKTYNAMVARGFENFFSQLQAPSQILDEVRTNTLFDVFETRDGVIVCQPPRYNRIELGFLNGQSLSDNADNVTSFFDVNTETGEASFSENADFFIKPYEFLATANTAHSDMDLDTHVDVQFTWPLVGTVDVVPGGGYTDPNLYVKYGLRAKGPITNPNVNNRKIAYIFAPIVLGYLNARTRTFDLTVKDSRKFEVGKLYVLTGDSDTLEPSPKAVAYLEKATLNHAFNQVSSVTLSFVMARELVQRNIKDILDSVSDDEVLNFSLCYLTLPTDDEFKKGVRSVLVRRGLAALKALQSRGVTSIPMFKYIPSVTDLMLAIAENTALIEADTVSGTTAGETREDSSETPFPETATDGTWLYDVGTFLDSPREPRAKKTQKMLDAFVKMSNPETVVMNSDVIEEFMFPTNFLAYSSSFPSEQWVARQTSEGGVHKNLVYVKSPFKVDSVVGNRGSYFFSQYLTNRIVSLDQDMKLSEKADQLYSLSGGSYKLFGVENPAFYISSNLDVLYPSTVERLMGGRKIPGVLKFSNAGNTPMFENDYFKVEAKNATTGEFRLPPGHIFIIRDSGVFSRTNISMVFAELSGGNYNVARYGNYLEITPRGEATLRSYSSVGGTSVDEPPSEHDSSKPFRTSVGDSDIFMCSPYSDISLERMVEFLPSQNLCGYRSAETSRAKVNVAGGTYFENPSNVESHHHGRGLDVSPENVPTSSGSDLVMKEEGYLFSKNLITASANKYYYSPPTQRGGIKTVYPLQVVASDDQWASVRWKYINLKETKTSKVRLIHLGVTPNTEREDLIERRERVKAEKPIQQILKGD